MPLPLCVVGATGEPDPSKDLCHHALSYNRFSSAVKRLLTHSTWRESEV